MTERCESMERKQWRNEGLRSLKEALPRLREDNLEKAARSYKATPGVDCDGLHPKDPPDISK